MNITCPHCSTKLNLPDAKIPKHKDTAFKCPKCRGAITVKATESAHPSTAPVPDSTCALDQGTGGPDLIASGGESVFLRKTPKARALVCMAPSGTRDLLAGSTHRLDFTMDFPKNPFEALEYLEYQVYPLVVLDDAFDPDRRILFFINDMDMSLRRRICLVRICQGAETGNAMAALHGNANFMLRVKDMAMEDDFYIEDMLNLALADHQKFYAVFNESMKVTGKA